MSPTANWGAKKPSSNFSATNQFFEQAKNLLWKYLNFILRVECTYPLLVFVFFLLFFQITNCHTDMYVEMKSSRSCQENKKSTSLQRWLYLPPVLHYLQSTPLFLLLLHLLTSPQLQWRHIGCSHDCSDVVQLPFCCRNLHCRCMCEFSPPWSHLSVSRGTSAECLQR